MRKKIAKWAAKVWVWKMFENDVKQHIKTPASPSPTWSFILMRVLTPLLKMHFWGKNLYIWQHWPRDSQPDKIWPSKTKRRTTSLWAVLPDFFSWLILGLYFQCFCCRKWTGNWISTLTHGACLATAQVKMPHGIEQLMYSMILVDMLELMCSSFVTRMSPFWSYVFHLLWVPPQWNCTFRAFLFLHYLPVAHGITRLRLNIITL